MAKEYTNVFSEVLLKIVLSEQLGLFCFLIILKILKELHSKKPDTRSSMTEESPPNNSSSTNNPPEHLQSTSIYRNERNITSVKSDNKYNISTIKQSPSNPIIQSDKKKLSLREHPKFLSSEKESEKLKKKKDFIPKPDKLHYPKSLPKMTDSNEISQASPISFKPSKVSIFKVLPSTFLSMYNLMIFHSVAVITVLANMSYSYYVLSVIYSHMIMFILTFIMFQRQSKCANLFEALTFSINTILILLSLVHTATNLGFFIDFKNFIESYTFYV